MPVRRSSVGWSIAGSWLVCFNCLQGKGSYTSSEPIGTIVGNDIISIDMTMVKRVRMFVGDKALQLNIKL